MRSHLRKNTFSNLSNLRDKLLSLRAWCVPFLKGKTMQSEKLKSDKGIPIRKVILNSCKRRTELYYQEFDGSWVQYKRKVFTIH